MTHRHIYSRLRFVGLAILATLAFYVATVGVVPAISRHMEDGRLQGLRSSLVASAILETYEWPAQRLAVLRPMRWLFESSAAFWCTITDAPETTA